MLPSVSHPGNPFVFGRQAASVVCDQISRGLCAGHVMASDAKQSPITRFEIASSLRCSP
jgi:hypothetical protein